MILEGSYSNLPQIRAYADLMIIMNTSWEIREKRLMERESPASLKRFYDLWIPLENACFIAYGLADDSCVLILEEMDKAEMKKRITKKTKAEGNTQEDV